MTKFERRPNFDAAQIKKCAHDLMLMAEQYPEQASRLGQIPGTTAEEKRANLEKLLADRQKECTAIFVNDMYQVSVYDRDEPPAEGWPRLIHLSIKRHDREPIMDWRDMQEIKNQLVGPECEGVQLFPAESRLVDTANQYHLFVIAKQGVHWPFGFTAGRVVTNQVVGSVSKQRNR